MSKLVRFIPQYIPFKVVSALSEVVDWGLQFTGIEKYRSILKTRGENIKVVILDTGASPAHPDLCDNFKDYEDFTGENDPMDRLGHATHVAGIIGASDNSIGVVGVAPRCSLYSGKVLNNQGLCPPDYSWIIKGLEWAIDMKADIVNLSLGAPIVPPAALHKVIRKATSQGMVIVAASGNEQLKNIDFPGRYEEVISVAAMDKNGRIANYSNIGPGLDFVAPGSDIYSTYINSGYSIVSGTSMSSPFIAGISALLLSYHRDGKEHKTPIHNYQDIIDHIKKFEKGKLIDFGDGSGIGILDFSTCDENFDCDCKVGIKSVKNSWRHWRLSTINLLNHIYQRIIKGK